MAAHSDAKSDTPAAATRFIPSKENVLRAVEQLPDPEKCVTETFTVDLGKGRTIEFRRIKYKSSKGRGYRWLFEGKMSV